MIVKNESENIIKLLNSCYHLINNYCICDTGSTDNTVKIIEDFFERKEIPGIVFSESFRNFSYNRNIAFTRAKEYADYILLLDADMIIEDKGFNKEDLIEDVYLINDNIRLIKSDCSLKIKEPVYEYFDIKKPYTQDILNTINIIETREPNYEKNISLLNSALKKEPNNPHNIFYIANCYKNIGDFENAKKWYQRKLEEKGWNQEVFMTYFYLCQIFRNKLNLLKKYALEGYQMGLGRIETLYLYLDTLMGYQRYEEVYQLAKHVKIPEKVEGLFIQQEIYDWKMEYLMSMLYYYVEEYQKGFDISISLLRKNKLPEEEYNLVLENIGFYLDKQDFSTNIDFLFNKTVLSDVAFKQIDRMIRNSDEYDDFRHIPLSFSKDNEIYGFIIANNNYKLFEKTLNSFINHCTDINLLTKMICLDNNSEEDVRLKISRKFPFLDFIYLESEEECFNMMRKIIRKERPKYFLFLEDNWLFFKQDKYLSKMKNILNKKKIHQISFNQNFAKTYDEISKNTSPNFQYFPSLVLSIIFDKLDEKEVLTKYSDEDFKTDFFKEINCLTIKL